MTRLQMLELECRTNPAGPVLMDPLGLPVVAQPPVATAPSTPDATPSSAPTDPVINAIIATTIGALAQP